MSDMSMAQSMHAGHAGIANGRIVLKRMSTRVIRIPLSSIGWYTFSCTNGLIAFGTSL